LSKARKLQLLLIIQKTNRNYVEPHERKLELETALEQ